MLLDNTMNFESILLPSHRIWKKTDVDKKFFVPIHSKQIEHRSTPLSTDLVKDPKIKGAL